MKNIKPTAFFSGRRRRASIMVANGQKTKKKLPNIWEYCAAWHFRYFFINFFTANVIVAEICTWNRTETR